MPYYNITFKPFEDYVKKYLRECSEKNIPLKWNRWEQYEKIIDKLPHCRFEYMLESDFTLKILTEAMPYVMENKFSIVYGDMLNVFSGEFIKTWLCLRIEEQAKIFPVMPGKPANYNKIRVLIYLLAIFMMMRKNAVDGVIPTSIPFPMSEQKLEECKKLIEGPNEPYWESCSFEGLDLVLSGEFFKQDLNNHTLSFVDLILFDYLLSVRTDLKIYYGIIHQLTKGF